MFISSCYNDKISWSDNSHNVISTYLPMRCYNLSSCQNFELKFFKNEPCIKATQDKESESECKWITFHTLALQTWMKNKSKDPWPKKDIWDDMSISIITSSVYLVALVKMFNLSLIKILFLGF